MLRMRERRSDRGRARAQDDCEQPAVVASLRVNQVRQTGRNVVTAKTGASICCAMPRCCVFAAGMVIQGIFRDADANELLSREMTKFRLLSIAAVVLRRY